MKEEVEYTRSPIRRLAEALLDSGKIIVLGNGFGDGFSTRSRDLYILTDIIGRHLEPKKIEEESAP